MRKDKYRNLDELKRAEPADAWSQSSRNPVSWLIVVAPHGGCIEPFTTEIAHGIAGTEYKLFVFEGRLGPNQDCYRRLHVTSTNFRDAFLTSLQKESEVTLAIHGARNPEDEADLRITWIGGRNEAVRLRIEHSLTASDFVVRQARDGHPYAGEDRENFVNEQHDGVQLELSAAERASLREDATRCASYIDAVRVALVQYKNPEELPADSKSLRGEGEGEARR